MYNNDNRSKQQTAVQNFGAGRNCKYIKSRTQWKMADVRENTECKQVTKNASQTCPSGGKNTDTNLSECAL